MRLLQVFSLRILILQIRTKMKRKDLGGLKRRETNPRKSHQIKEEKVSHQFQSLVMDILEQNEKAF